MAVDATRPVAALALGESASVAWRALWTSRLLIFVSGVGAVLIWGLSGRHAAFDPAGLTSPFGHLGDELVSPFARWDSKWYLEIANSGYSADDPQRAAFFPLYPLLVATFGAILGSPLIAGILISCVCAWVGLAFLHRLTEIELGGDAARHTVWLLAFCPMAFFFSAVYSESLFLMLSIGAILAARTGRWPWAATLGVLAAATRNTGVLLVLPLALLWWQRRDRLGDLLWIACVPLGLLAFCVWTATHNGAFLDTFHAAKLWYREFDGPFSSVWKGTVAAWDGARQLLHGSQTPVYYKQAGGWPFVVAWHNLLPIPFLLAGIWMFAGAVRRLPIAYWAYAFVVLLLALSYPPPPQPLASFPRYEIVIFPLFMWLGWWVSRGSRTRMAVVYGICAGGLVAFTAQFATWHWVA
jgi:hypothetical protein